MGVDAVLGRFGAQCNRSTLSIVNHCHPSEATRRALHAANPLCSLFQPSVGQAGNLIKRSWTWGLTQIGWMVERRGGKNCVESGWWCFGGAEGQGHNRTICSGVGFRLVDELERFCATQSVGQGGPVFIPPFIPPSIPPPFHLPPPTTTCLQATTSVPREMSATEKKAHKGLTFHMAGSPRLKRPDNPRRLD